MLFCDQCGRENRRGARFCSFCGKIISNDQSPSAPVLKSMSDNPINASEAPTLIEEPLLSPIPVQPNEEVAATLPGEPLLNTLVPEEDVSTSGILIEVSPTGEISSPNGTPSIHTGTISMPYTGKTVPLSLLPLQNQEDILDSGVSTGEILSQITPEFSPFEVLPDGTMLQGRYKLLNGEWEGETILYQAEDMLTCWNCHAVQTESDSTFCEACGAEMVPKISLFLRASRPTGEVSGSEAAENRFVEWYDISCGTAGYSSTC